MYNGMIFKKLERSQLYSQIFIGAPQISYEDLTKLEV